MNDVEKPGIAQCTDDITADVRTMISKTREGIAQVVNRGISLLYWRFRKRIKTEVIGFLRAEQDTDILKKVIRSSGEITSRGNSVRWLPLPILFLSQRLS